MAKSTMIKLKCEALGEREFEISVAETILNMRKNGGWILADNNFELKDGIIVRRNKKESKG